MYRHRESIVIVAGLSLLLPLFARAERAAKPARALRLTAKRQDAIRYATAGDQAFRQRLPRLRATLARGAERAKAEAAQITLEPWTPAKLVARKQLLTERAARLAQADKTLATYADRTTGRWLRRGALIGTLVGELGALALDFIEPSMGGSYARNVPLGEWLAFLMPTGAAFGAITGAGEAPNKLYDRQDAVVEALTRSNPTMLKRVLGDRASMELAAMTRNRAKREGLEARAQRQASKRADGQAREAAADKALAEASRSVAVANAVHLARFAAELAR